MLTDSLDQNFGQGTRGMGCLCSVMAEASAGRFECLGDSIIWSLLHSPVWHIRGLGWLEGRTQLCVLELGSHTGALSMCLELLHSVGNIGQLDFLHGGSRIQGRLSEWRGQKLHGLYSLRSHTSSLPPYLTGQRSHKPIHIQEELTLDPTLPMRGMSSFYTHVFNITIDYFSSDEIDLGSV